MAKLTLKEQVLLAYYIYNFLEDTEQAMRELENILQDSLQENHVKSVEELQREGLVDSSKEDGKERITNEGVLYINNILHIQSESTDGNKLAHVKDSLLTYEIAFTEETLKEYIYKNVGITDENN
ncbi:hypothetical protein [Psychrobacillus lasiicapitis]|uniref:Uncharacterized protein n=1 Tax=Psychrobacillus lasiicapitis TaxID=1636719 RepID=A0A544T4W1_9BACI|nr:hypothetical protein [Psychrobacillus lasiicapitis]TQR12481.1 hypothetical protein FG382_12705 [Psychrobacillus lasiicapitis]GGA38481.1 hypothetical protein GCM10011384_30020 [Psychrobacillus lasiicapitis]